MRLFFLAFATVLLCGCNTPYGTTGTIAGTKIFALSDRKIEIMAVGPHNTSYDELARMWKVKADETAAVRGASSYEIVSFSTGREMLGVEFMGENSFLERYAEDMAFWTPKVARGVILLNDPLIRPTSAGRFR